MEIWWNYKTTLKIRHFDKIWRFAVHIITHNFFRQFLNVTFNEIFCLLTLFLFYGTTAKYFASGNTWWLLWPKCWLETEFDYRFRLRFSLLIQLILSKCVVAAPSTDKLWAMWLSFLTRKVLPYDFSYVWWHPLILYSIKKTQIECKDMRPVIHL